MSENPFQFGSEFSTDDLVGRSDEVRQVENTIRDGSRLFLIAPRRFGKTSILRAAEESMTRKGAIVLRVNAEAVPSPYALIEQILTGAAIRLKEHYEDGYEQMGRFFSRFRPEIRSGEDGEGVSVRINMDPYASGDQQINALTDTLDCLDRMAAAQPDSRPVALIIDEFSALASRGGEMAEAKIRSVTQQHQNIGYIFTGSNVRLMMDMTGKHNRPFYRGGMVYYIRTVPTDEFAVWLYAKFREGGFEVDGDEVTHSILSLAEEIPYNVQMLAHHCWEELRSQRRAKLTVSLVREVFKRTVNSLYPLFAHTWNQLSPVQQRTLVAFLRGNGRMNATEMARSAGFSDSSFKTALRWLHEHDILWNDFTGEGKKIRFEDPFFAQWVRINV